MKLNECIIIAGEKDGKHFLAKNRDRRFVGEYVIKQEIYKGIEVAGRVSIVASIPFSVIVKFLVFVGIG
jgi:hypothetical protein